jgi:hypothetical protein
MTGVTHGANKLCDRCTHFFNYFYSYALVAEFDPILALKQEYELDRLYIPLKLPIEATFVSRSDLVD